ncbi:tetratricopeptide repeat protein [Actinophytocola sp.]|uniref:AfsR/SARP family transcriptional regulator n=1 Tax=Actinophytocola sp. TaxID=1872138 RepID=UPI00389A01CE
MYVGVLGAFEASADGEPLRLRRRQQRLLLALLALNANVPLPADRIADLLWDDEPPPTARNHVQVLVSASRKAVRATGARDTAIGTSALGYRLDAPPAEVDLLSFEQDVARGERAVAAGRLDEAVPALRSALSRWRGRPLGDLTGRFAESESARLTERRLAVELRWIDVELALGRADHLVADLTRQCADWPLHEGLRSRLVVALYAVGRPADALGAYRAGARLLAEEQGMVRPGERLRAVHEAVLRGDPVEQVVAAVAALPSDVRVPAPVHVRPGQLPPDVTDFTGRDDCVAWLDRAGPGVSVLSGTAGVGKTAAAVHWAHRARDRFPDGQLYLDLRGFSDDAPMSAGEALARMLAALGVTDLPAGVDAQADLFRSLTADRRVLVVLDNAASPGQVRPLLPGGAASHVVITSRGLMSGLVVREGARRLVLELLPEDDAVRLLSRVIGAARAGSEPAAVRELARQCARLPLALRVLAERIAARPGLRLADLSAELTVQRRTLDVLTTADDETAAMRPVFSWSYRSLPPDAARLFRLLGLHAGPHVNGLVAAALAGVPGAGDLLDRLTGAHLLTVVGQDRYQSHDLLRCYARELADEREDDERERAVRDMLTWYLLTADAANTALMPQRMAVPITARPGPASPLRFDSPDRARTWFEAEHPNLVAAVGQAADEGLHDIAWQLPATLWSFFYLSKRWADWTGTHTVGLASARLRGDEHGEARMLHSLGTAAWNQGLLDEARGHYDGALAIWRRSEDRLGESQTLNNLGATLCARQEFDQALTCYRRALRLRTEIGDRRGQGQTLNNLGEAHRELSQFGAAIGYFEQALDIHREVADSFGQSETLANLGVLHREVGRSAEAVEYFRRALAVCRGMGDSLGVAEYLIELGRTLRQTGASGPAHDSWAEASAVLSGLPGADAARLRADLADLTGVRAYAGPR